MPATQQVTKGFENENTVWRLKQENRLDEFHKRYDDALAKCRRELGKAYTLIIAGERVNTKNSFDDTNPSNTKEVIGRFASATPEDTQKGIKAAAAAFPKWSSLDYKERIKILRKAAELMRQRKYEFAAWMTLENGKPRIESMNDV
ncbi:MAG TPA: aldehyde dehydrogenase family protein, partial [Candidatus Thermoplasmatota archaeon]|nr:aldehyde dehydrogenase family protein [Candidatus Thermoplasmatota archaeon]